MTKRTVIGVVGIVVFCAAYIALERYSHKVDKAISSPTLAPGDNEKLILDPRKHTITTVTRTGPVKETYLPPHVTAITVDKDGKVTVHTREWGTEASPFIGFGYSDRTRLMLGVGLLYWHNWEGGMALTPTISGPFSIRLALLASYNVYNNTSLFVGVTNDKSPIGGITFKF